MAANTVLKNVVMDDLMSAWDEVHNLSNGSASAIQQLSTNSSNTSCFDPSDKGQFTSKLQCHCMADLITWCRTSGQYPLQHHVSCILDLACTDASVCESWRNASCSNGTLNTNVLLNMRMRTDSNRDHDRNQLLERSSNLIEETYDNGVETALQSKCHR
jgi:hypothetical protein